MDAVRRSQLQDRAVIEELLRGDLLRRASRASTSEFPYAEGAAGSRGMSMAEAVERVKSDRIDPLNPSFAEAIIMREGYPSLLVKDGDYEEPQLEVWRTRLNPHRAIIRSAIASVGRVELDGHPQYKWVGTGWVIDDDVIVTNRHVAEVFVDPSTDNRSFERGVVPSVDFVEEHGLARELIAAIRDIVHVERPDGPDMAILKVERGRLAALGIQPLAIAQDGPGDGFLGVIGYPAFDGRNNADDQSRIFRDIYDKKRFAPGKVMNVSEFAFTFSHNCTTLGGNSGSAVIQIETGAVAGLHFGGREGDRNHAVNARTIRDIASRHGVRVRGVSGLSGGAGGGSHQAAEAAGDLSGRKGYDPAFLDPAAKFAVPLPRLNALQLRQVAKLKAGGGMELKYTHFSVVMNGPRRLAFLSAVNIDGTSLWHNPRGRDNWLLDPRIDEIEQVDNALYQRNDFDRGHLVRRLDPVWGSREEAAQAEADTFFYTNAAPQHKDLNQKIWLDLENHVLGGTDERDVRINVFAGPVFGSADPRSRRTGLEEVGIPLGFWKVTTSIGRTRGDRRALQAQAFVIWQWDMFGDRDLELVFGRGFETYQLPVSDLERLTGLDFGEGVRAADTFGETDADDGTESAAGVLRIRREPIRKPGDIVR